MAPRPLAIVKPDEAVSLAAAFTEARNPPSNRRRKCDVSTVLRMLSPDDAAQVQAWLDDDGVDGAHIARTLNRLGYGVKGQTVQRHRRGDCQCPN